MNSAPYAVEGVASGTPTPREFRLMLQSLLEERFALNTIVVDRAGKLGPNVKVWDGTCMNGAKPTDEDQPSTAVKEQWGLRFEKGMSPFRLVTVENAQQPAAN